MSPPPPPFGEPRQRPQGGTTTKSTKKNTDGVPYGGTVKLSEFTSPVNLANYCVQPLLGDHHALEARCGWRKSTDVLELAFPVNPAKEPGPRLSQ